MANEGVWRVSIRALMQGGREAGPPEAGRLRRARVPAGFGRGRRANHIAVIQTHASRWKELPARIHQWGPEEVPDFWTRAAVHGLLTGVEQTGFGMVWRYWMKNESPEQLADSLFPFAALRGTSDPAPSRDRPDQADAAVLLAPQEEHYGIVPVLEERGIPVVLAFARRDDPQAIWAACDNRGGVAQAVAHLVGLGHSSIGFIGGPAGVADFGERRQGYLRGLEEAGLEFDPSLVVEVSSRDAIRDMRPAVTSLLRRPGRPTALVCCTDLVAFGVLEIAWEMGMSVPQDVAVIGFDDSEEATQTVPPLTTIRQPVAGVAGMACYLAACAVVGQEPETGSWQMDLPVSLIVRESCGSMLRANAGAEMAPGPRAEVQAMRRQMEWQMRQLVAINEELEELLYVASHDLRSPLVTIQGFASVLDRKYGDGLDPRGREYVQRIRSSAASMGELMDTLLTLSRSQSQPLNLRLTLTRDTAKRVLHDLEGPLTERGARVHLPARMPTVLADEIGLYQIFLNLIGNALKFLGDQPHPIIHIGYRGRTDEHEFSVRDNGIGIAPEHHHEIFQAFRRLGEAKIEGTGIGLTIVKRMVLRHGGRIWVESARGAGTTFRFTLPRRETE